MAILDGEPVNAAVSNPSWISKNTDDVTPSKLGLGNTAPESGSTVSNLQTEVNSSASFMGKALNAVKDILPAWATSNRGTSSDTLLARAEATDTAFNGTTGHKHTGSTGDGTRVDAISIANVPIMGFAQQGINLVAVTGTSVDVSTQMTGSFPSAGSSSAGVVVTAPYNKIILRNSVDDTEFKDATGNVVYGRLTFAASVWTLSFYSEIAGVETAYTFASSGIVWYFQVLASTLDGTAPVYSDLFFVPSSNATADVVNASLTQRGLVNTTTQTYAGVKTFNSVPILGTLTGFLKGVSGSISTAMISLTGDVTGILPIANGGTGQATQNNAIDALTGTQSVGKYLRSDGTHATLDSIHAADVPTLNQSTTGNADTATTAVSVSGTNVVTNSNLSQMPAMTIKGNNTGSTANAADLTASQATSVLSVMTGDSGLGGVKGLVPAPAAGDAAASKFLKADGTWAVSGGGGGGTTIVARYFDSTGVTANTVTPFNFQTLNYDNTSAVTTGGNWKFTASVTGFYSVKLVILTSVTCAINIWKNGTVNSQLCQIGANLAGSGSTDIQLNAGDYIDIRPDRVLTTLASLPYWNSVAIAKIGS